MLAELVDRWERSGKRLVLEKEVTSGAAALAKRSHGRRTRLVLARYHLARQNAGDGETWDDLAEASGYAGLASARFRRLPGDLAWLPRMSGFITAYGRDARAAMAAAAEEIGTADDAAFLREVNAALERLAEVALPEPAEPDVIGLLVLARRRLAEVAGELPATRSAADPPAWLLGRRATWLFRLAQALVDEEHDPVLLDEARRLAREAAALLSRVEDADEAVDEARTVLDDLIARIDVLRYEPGGDVEDLRRGLAGLERAITHAYPEDTLLELRYRFVEGCLDLQTATGDTEWAGRAVPVLRDMLRLYPGRAEVPNWKRILASRLFVLYHEDPLASEPLLREAVTLLDDPEVRQDESDSDRGLRAAVLTARYTVELDPGVRAELGLCVRSVLDQAERGQPGALRTLLTVFHTMFLLYEEPLLPPLYHPLLRPALGTLDESAPEYAETLRIISALALMTVDLDGLGLLETCITSLRPLAAARPDPGAVLVLAAALRARYQATGEPASLGEADRHVRTLLAETTADSFQDDEYAYLLMMAGGIIYDHALAGGRPGALLEAADLLRRAIEAAPPGWRFTPSALDVQGQILCALFEATSDRRHLDESVRSLRQAVQVAEGRSVHILADALASLSYALGTLCQHDADDGLLEEARTVGRAAVAARPDGARAANNLGSILRLSYSRTGDLAELDEVVACERRAVALTPRHHADRSFYLTNLVAGLLTRYDASLEGFVLDEARALLDEAMRDLSWSSRHASTTLVTFCHLQYTLFSRHQDAEMLTSAVAAAQRAIGDIPTGDVRRISAHNSLAVLFTAHYEAYGDLGSVEEAEGLLATVTGDDAIVGTELVVALMNRSDAQLAIFQETGRAEALLGAESGLRRSLGNATHLADQQEAALLRLGTVLVEIHRHLGRPDALTEARRTFAAIAGDEDADVDERFQAARGLAQIIAMGGDATEAVRAYGRAADLLTELAPLSMSWQDRRDRLRHLAGFAADAARAALAADDAERAVELLEQSRGILLADARDLDADLARLDELMPEACAEYRRLRERMRLLGTAEHPSPDPLPGPTSSGESERIRAERGELRSSWEELLDSIHAHPEFTSFLRPLPFDRIRAMIDDVPVVMVLAGTDGGHAIIVSPDGADPVPLPDLTGDALVREANAIQAALAADFSDRRKATDDLLDALGWIWDAVAEPVLKQLGIHGPSTGDPPRIRWCPVGNAAFLPLHAAGRPGIPGRSVLDRAASSYTPTIRALGQALDQAPAADAAVLVVSQPDTPGAPPLNAVADEAAGILRLVPRARHIEGPGATRDAVLDAIQRCSIAHLACHGVGDALAGPPRLVLHDHREHPLTVESLARLRLRADLAFLSACSSTGPSRSRVDEALHITSGFLIAGYRQVIGTLWPVADRAAADFAVAFYAELTRDGRRPPDPSRAPFALRDVALRVREDHPRNPFGWAAYLHVGA